jgi:hypothetical protein
MSTATTTAETPTRQEPTPGPDAGAFVFVWGVWAAMLVAGLAFVGYYGSRYTPLLDDWNVTVPVLTGEQPLDLAWLWAQAGDHRIPVPKLVQIGLYKVSGYDFRAGMFFNVLALGFVALAMLMAAGRLRGQSSYSDAIFPLALLGLGQYNNLLWSLNVSFILSAALASVFLLIIVLNRSVLSLGVTLLAGVCLVLLTLCGPGGLACVPALGLWLAYSSARRWSTPGPFRRVTGVVGFVSVALAFLLVALYFVGYERPDIHPPSPGLKATSEVALEVLSLSLVQGDAGGWLVQKCWPYSGWVTLGLVLLTALVLVAVFLRRPEERSRALGILLFIGATACIGLGIGWGRAGFPNYPGLQSRYCTYAMPLLCCVYFTWVLYGAQWLRRLVQMCLFTTFCVFFPLTVEEAVSWAGTIADQMKGFEKDLVAGTPTAILVERHARDIMPDTDPAEAKRSMTEKMRSLRRAGIGMYRDLKDDPVMDEVRFSAAPIGLNQMREKDGKYIGEGDDPYLVFALGEPRFVYAIRLKCSYEGTPNAPPMFQAFWKEGSEDFVEKEGRVVTQELKGGPEEQTVMIPVNSRIDQFRIDPDTKPCVFRIHEIVLLIPPRDAHQELIEHIREEVRKLPADATVLVVGRGADDFLKMEGRKTWHFPRDEDGNFPGNPENGKEAVDALKAQRDKGAQYLLFPQPAFWWLTDYKEFKDHLDSHYTQIHADKHCIIYRLAAPKGK